MNWVSRKKIRLHIRFLDTLALYTTCQKFMLLTLFPLVMVFSIHIDCMFFLADSSPPPSSLKYDVIKEHPLNNVLFLTILIKKFCSLALIAQYHTVTSLLDPSFTYYWSCYVTFFWPSPPPLKICSVRKC